MPIYVYQCAECAKSFEELVMNDAQEKVLRCPGCQSARLLRKLSSFAAIASTGSGGDFPSCGAGACDSCSFDD